MINKEILERMYLVEKKTTLEIAKFFKFKSKSSIGYWLQKYKIPTRKTGGAHNFKNLVGKKFGRLTVVKRKLKTSPAKSGDITLWICKCKCGKETIVSRSSLIKKLTKSCGCLRKELMFHGYENLSGCYWNNILKGAKKRGLDVSITIKDAWKKYVDQNKKCALSGLSINIVRNLTKDRIHHTASLDRIDNKKGYIKGNIQWVHRDINIMRNNMNIDEFLYYCKKIVNFN